MAIDNSRRGFFKRAAAIAVTSAFQKAHAGFFTSDDHSKPPAGTPALPPLQYDMVDENGVGINFFHGNIGAFPEPTIIAITDTNLRMPIANIKINGTQIQVEDIQTNGTYTLASFNLTDRGFVFVNATSNGVQRRETTPEIGHIKDVLNRALMQMEQYKNSLTVIESYANSDRRNTFWFPVNQALGPNEVTVKASALGYGRGAAEITHTDFNTSLLFGPEYNSQNGDNYSTPEIHVTTTFYNHILQRPVTIGIHLRSDDILNFSSMVNTIANSINQGMPEFDYLSLDNLALASEYITQTMIKDVLLGIRAMNCADGFGQRTYPEFQNPIAAPRLSHDVVFGNGRIGGSLPQNYQQYQMQQPAPVAPSQQPSYSAPASSPTAPTSFNDSEISCNIVDGKKFGTVTSSAADPSLSFTQGSNGSVSFGGIVKGQDVYGALQNGAPTKLGSTPYVAPGVMEPALRGTLPTIQKAFEAFIQKCGL